MAAVADFILLSKTALGGLLKASSTREAYWDYLRRHGRIAAVYGWSGYIFASLIPYLAERWDIDLGHSEYDGLARSLDKVGGLAHVFLTYAQRRAYLRRLEPKDFSERELGNYFNSLNAVNDPTAGRGMMDGIAVLHQCLNELDEHSVVLVDIS